MLYPTFIYFYELKWRLFYLFFSFIICFLVLLNYSHILILVEVFPLLNIYHRRFIATHITDLFNIVLLISFFWSIIWIYPFVIQQINAYLIPSWFELQLSIFKKFSKLLWIFFNALIFVFHFKFMHIILSFFLIWEIKGKYSLLQLEIESRIKDYFFWISKINIFIITFLLLIVFIFIIFLLILGPLFLYIIMKFYKKQYIFIIFIIFTFLLSFDINSQLLLFINIVFFFEIIFIILCYYLSKFIHKY